MKKELKVLRREQDRTKTEYINKINKIKQNNKNRIN